MTLLSSEIKYLCEGEDDDSENSRKALATMLNNILFLFLFATFWICSNTYLWRIETSPPSYIFGSIHVPYNLIWPYVSNETREAFLSSTHFYAEIDAQDDTYWDDFLQCLINRSNRTRRASQPSYVVDILDVYLITEARRLNKTVGGLETAKSICQNEVRRMNISAWKIAIDRVKKEMKNSTIPLPSERMRLYKPLIKKYVCDEITGQFFRTVKMSKKEKQRVEQRDKQMSKYMHHLLQRSEKDRYFFAVGAAHMLNDHRNLKTQLKKLGYKITYVCTDRKRLKKKYGCKNKKTTKHCLKKSH